ncbi:MAG: hypothetical protein LH616_15975, partial [Ilumatobacteraceae bacterium]|nr:hypothetical protein [Ilumatobacteraceae bacterium]
MPSRRRPKSPTHSPATSRPAASPATAGAGAPTDVERFAAALKESEKAHRAAKVLQQQERTDAAQRAEQAAAKATALVVAGRELERA